MAMVTRILSAIVLSGFSFSFGFHDYPEAFGIAVLSEQNKTDNVLFLDELSLKVMLVAPKNELCSDSSEWDYSIQFTSKSLLPEFINRNLPIETRVPEIDDEILWLRITRNDSVYIRSRLTGREGFPNKKAVWLFGSLEITDKLLFNQLVHENSVILTNEHSNEDYGKYKAQVIYVHGSDSISSNVVDINYYEDCNFISRD